MDVFLFDIKKCCLTHALHGSGLQETLLSSCMWIHHPCNLVSCFAELCTKICSQLPTYRRQDMAGSVVLQKKSSTVIYISWLLTASVPTSDAGCKLFH